MPAKSRRKRGKNPPPSKRIKHSGGSTSAAKVNQSPENTVESAAVETPVMPEKKSTTQVQTTSVRYPYISSEVRTIGILTVLILVILGILAAVL
jgi:hypothetical protein